MASVSVDVTISARHRELMGRAVGCFLGSEGEGQSLKKQKVSLLSLLSLPLALLLKRRNIYSIEPCVYTKPHFQ